MHRPLILHLDDSDLVLDIVGKGLEEEGFRVISIEQVALVADALQHHGMPDLILLDIDMPGVKGDDIAQFFRSQWQLDTPVVLFSDLPRAEIERRAEQSQATAFVRKNDGMPVLVETIRLLLGMGSAAGVAVLPPAGHSGGNGAATDHNHGAGDAGFDASPADAAAPVPDHVPPSGFRDDVDAWAERLRNLVMECMADPSGEAWVLILPDIQAEMHWLREETARQDDRLAARLAEAASSAFDRNDGDPAGSTILAGFVEIMAELAKGQPQRAEALLTRLATAG